MKVGITVGVWDYLHPGHVHHLSMAVQSCDVLLVGVVTDYLTKMQKGVEPDHNLQNRKAAISDLLPGAVLFDLSTLTLPRELESMVSVVYAGPDQLDRFWSLNCSSAERVIIPRYAPGGVDINSTNLRKSRAQRSNS